MPVSIHTRNTGQENLGHPASRRCAGPHLLAARTEPKRFRLGFTLAQQRLGRVEDLWFGDGFARFSLMRTPHVRSYLGRYPAITTERSERRSTIRTLGLRIRTLVRTTHTASPCSVSAVISMGSRQVQPSPEAMLRERSINRPVRSESGVVKSGEVVSSRISSVIRHTATSDHILQNPLPTVSERGGGFNS
jgi:hypothetical protein